MLNGIADRRSPELLSRFKDANAKRIAGVVVVALFGCLAFSVAWLGIGLMGTVTGSGGGSWQITEVKNPMTDRVELTATSIQSNGQGAVADVVGRCVEPGLVTFTATLVDDEGKPTLTFPEPAFDPDLRPLGLNGTRRINDGAAENTVFPSNKLSNRFVLITLRQEGAQQTQSEGFGPAFIQQLALALTGVKTEAPLETTKRVLTQIATSRGPLLTTILTSDVKRFVDACRAPEGVIVATCDRLVALSFDPKWPAFAANQIAPAVPACRAALANHPNDSRLMTQLGRALSKTADVNKAWADNMPNVWEAEDAKRLRKAAAENDAEAANWFRKAADAGFTR
jgi:hypothetical protein